MHIVFTILLSVIISNCAIFASNQPAAAAAGAGAGSSNSTRFIDNHFEMIIAKPNHQFTPQDKKQLIDKVATFGLDKKDTNPSKAKTLFDQAVVFQKKLEETYTDLNQENSQWFNQSILQPLATNIRHLRRIAGAASPKSARLLKDEAKRKRILLRADQISRQGALLTTQLLKRYQDAQAAIEDLTGRLQKQQAELDTLKVSQTNSAEETLTKMKALAAAKALRESEHQEAEARLLEAKRNAEQSASRLQEAETELFKFSTAQQQQLTTYTTRKFVLEEQIKNITKDLTAAQDIKQDLVEAGRKLGAQNQISSENPNENRIAPDTQAIEDANCCIS